MLGRPRKRKGWKTTSLMLFEEYSEIYEKARDLAYREGITFSDIVAKALAEYLKIHFPGHPQLPLPDKRPYEQFYLPLVKRNLRRLLDQPYPNRAMWESDLAKWVSKARGIRTRDAELMDLVKRATSQLS